MRVDKDPASTIPKAARSNITNLTVIPDTWDSYPTIERSIIDSCTFAEHNAVVERSRLTYVTISSALGPGAKKGSGKTVIERSILHDTKGTNACIERSKLLHSTVSQCKIKRSVIQNSEISGPKAKIEASEIYSSLVKGNTRIERSPVNNTIAEDCKLIRSRLDGVTLRKTTVEKSTLKNCNVEDCKLERTHFSGMYLRNAICDGGVLVGRVHKKKEVIMRPLTEAEGWNDPVSILNRFPYFDFWAASCANRYLFFVGTATLRSWNSVNFGCPISWNRFRRWR